MDQPPKKLTDPTILDDLKSALLGADRCIDLARRQRQQIDAASQALAAGGMHAENQLIEQARKRRESLEALKPRIEVTSPLPLEVAPPPPVDPSPAVVPILEEQAVLA